MLKLPKGLKKKKKGKKSKRKGEDELFTEEELEKYRKEHQKKNEEGEPSAKENEEWSKFKDLTTGVDSVLKKTQGDLDRIKSTSFFQRIPAGPKEVDRSGQEKPLSQASSPPRPIVEVTAADFPHLASSNNDADDERSDVGITDDESEDDDQDDIFDTSYVEAVERGEVRLAYVPDSPDELDDADIFDTSHVDALIKGQTKTSSRGKKALDIGVAVEVLTGRIDNVALPTTKRSKRVIPGDLLLESADVETVDVSVKSKTEQVEKSILDVDEDIPISTPIDLSVSLHTSLIQQNKSQLDNLEEVKSHKESSDPEEIDEFTLLAAESLEANAEVNKLENKEIKLVPVIQDSWSAFEADKITSVFAEGIVEDQLDPIDPYIDQDDPFDTSFADSVVPLSILQAVKHTALLEEDDDFDPRAEKVQVRLNNRRKSSVRIHLTDPSGIRESITSDDIYESEDPKPRDLLGTSCTDLTQLGDSPLDPVDINETDDYDPFDTTIVDKVAAPGKVELKLLEKELIGAPPVRPPPICRIPSDPDFDPRADECESPKISERRPSRPENLVVSKSVIFKVDCDSSLDISQKNKQTKPVTPYYTREISITEDAEETESRDFFPSSLTRTRSTEDLAQKVNYQTKRRHSELPKLTQGNKYPKSTELLESVQDKIGAKVLTPCGPPSEKNFPQDNIDPFDTSFAGEIAPSKIELKLLAKEFSCEDSNTQEEPHFLDPTTDELFQAKALSPEPTGITKFPIQDIDPFDTSFAADLEPGRSELKLLESELLN